jgi:hypothetical protein
MAYSLAPHFQEKSHMSKRFAATVAIVWAFSSVAVAGDDVTDAVEEGMQAYQQGHYGDAANQLDYASQLIRQKKGEELRALFPAPLPGWRVDEADSSATGAAIMGGGVTASRRYHREPAAGSDGQSAELKIELIADSPLLQSVMVMLSNPMYATANGSQLKTIKGQRAIVKNNGDETEVQMVIENKLLLTISGFGASSEDVFKYTESLDYQKLAAQR